MAKSFGPKSFDRKSLATLGAAAILAASLTACAGDGPQDATPFQDLFFAGESDEPDATPAIDGIFAGIEPGNGLPPAPTFTEALSALYPVLAERLAETGRDDARRFLQKAAQAEAGIVVQPDYPAIEPLPLQEKGALDTAYAQLMLLLIRGARDAAPVQAAEAQVTFDCWLEEAVSLSPNEEALTACRAQFLRLATELGASVTAATPIRIFFASGGTALDPAAEAKLEEVASLVRQTGATVDLIGRTDAIGSAAANERLSLRRAQRVRDALIRLGVPADRIGEVVGRGEDEAFQEVATGVAAEASDRRVDIILRR